MMSLASVTAMHPAIVLGGGSANGLGIARNLGSLGIPVYCLTSNARDLTRFSKHCTRYAIVPRIESDLATLRWTLQQLRKALSGTGVLFPTTDTAVLTLAQLQDELQGYVTALPDRELVETMVIKTRFYASLRQWGVPHPQTEDLDERSRPPVVAQRSFPVFLRPAQSLPFVQAFGRKGFIAHTPTEVQAYLTLATQTGHTLMLQEIIPGPPTSEYALRGFLDKQSRPIVLVVTQRVRRLELFALSPIMRSVPLATVADFVEVILTYLRNIKYTGLFMAEFKRDARDGRFKLLEINARSAGSNYIVKACGANHILAAYRTALGEAVDPTTTYEANVYNIYLKFDVHQSVLSVLHGRPLNEPLTPYLGKKQWQNFSKHDPLPFIMDIITTFRS